jgi:hypothetical protein
MPHTLTRSVIFLYVCARLAFCVRPSCLQVSCFNRFVHFYFYFIHRVVLLSPLFPCLWSMGLRSIDLLFLLEPIAVNFACFRCHHLLEFESCWLCLSDVRCCAACALMRVCARIKIC